MATHFTPDERDSLSDLLACGTPKAQIARLLGRSRKTIFEEIRRNSVTEPYSGRRKYCAARAQQLADQRRHQRRSKKMDQTPIREVVERGLEQYWSPDQIAGRMRLEFANEPRLRISHETIYGWIRRHDHRRRWQRFLRRQRSRKRRRSAVPQNAVIANRPAVIERRERLGDWEGDTIHGAGRSGALVSLVDRKSRYLVLAKVDNLQSATVNRAVCRRLKRFSPAQRHSITFDQGAEFAAHEQLAAALGVAIYFAKPHCPWQRGTNENTNGLARQFFPKGTSCRELSHARTARIQSLLNERPRKRLGYHTPQEIFFATASDTILT